MPETATIEGMLLDLSKGDCSTHLATLGLTESVAELADANSRYKALAAQRTTSVSDAKTPDSKSLRAELDALYVYISDVAFAHNVVSHYRTGPLYPRRERYKHFYQRLSPTQFYMLNALLSYSSCSCSAAEILYASDCGAKIIASVDIDK